VLRDWGIDWRAIAGPIGAASALKMSYAGITKGTTAIASAMLLGAARFGCAEGLIAELTESQPEMLARFRESIPRMYDKAYRWVAEMEEISDFLQDNPPSRDIYAAVARLYAYLAEAEAEAEKEPGPDNAVRTLDRVLGKG
jgi:L-threonate 2-dehydrogenase